MKLSIITINRNNAAGLKKTIQSVASQSYTDFEYIVIDGASNDGSVDVIKTYTDKITYWVSETDTGIYNAMNKGIRKARGDYCLFLNSGDWLIDDTTLARVFEEIKKIGDADIYYSDMEKTDGSIKYYNKKISMLDIILDTLNHQNSLIKKDLFVQHGYYNEDLRISSDWEFFLQEMYIHHASFVYIGTHISKFDTNGIGSQGTAAQLNEDKIVFKNVFGIMGESLIKLRLYNNSVYGTIIETYGSSKLLEFMLRSYRYIIKRISSFLKRNKQQRCK